MQQADIRRGRTYTVIGALLGMAATAALSLFKQAGSLDSIPWAAMIAVAVPPLIAVIGLSVFERRPRPGAALVMIAAGLGMGVAAVGSLVLVGVLWLPAGVLLTLGAHRLWTGSASPPVRRQGGSAGNDAPRGRA